MEPAAPPIAGKPTSFVTVTRPPDSPSKELVVIPASGRSAVVIDIGVEVAARLSRGLTSVARSGLRLGLPVAAVVLRPPGVPRKYWPRTYLLAMADRGRSVREHSEAQTRAQLSVMVPMVVDAVLDRIDLTKLVLDRVQVASIVESLDFDAIAASLDLDALVASVDIEAVIARVDVDAIASRLDLDAIVDRLDIVTIAREVIDEIDLPEIIRESSSAMASETVVGVRMRGIEADERVSRIVERVMMRRRGRDAPTIERGADSSGDG
jgi:hypothetical protein